MKIASVINDVPRDATMISIKLITLSVNPNISTMIRLPESMKITISIIKNYSIKRGPIGLHNPNII